MSPDYLRQVAEDSAHHDRCRPITDAAERRWTARVIGIPARQLHFAGVGRVVLCRPAGCLSAEQVSTTAAE